MARVYGHPADDKGILIPPKVEGPGLPATFEQEMMDCEALCSAFGVPRDQRDAALEAIRARHGRQSGG